MATSTSSAGPSMASVDIRRTLVETLRLNLIGQNNDHEFADDLLPKSPTRWYLTGYLVPTDAPIVFASTQIQTHP